MTLPTALRGSRWRVLDDWLESGYKGFLKYRKWLLLGFWAYVVTIIAGLLLLIGMHEFASRQRDAAYHATLQSYQENLKPGVTRKGVESYVRAKNTQFIEDQNGDLMVMIGEEKLPWYVWWCHGESIYVEFQFIAPARGAPNERDELETVFLSKTAEGCL